MARVSIFLITVALIAGMVGCGPTQYKLTISSTEGGQVTIPGEDTFTYEEKRLVDLVAQAEEGYQFVNWTGNVTTIANVNAAITTITVNGDYSITANFVPDGFEAIWNWYDLDAIRDNLTGHYALMNDLDSSTAGYEELASPTANGGEGWQPIGTIYEWGDRLTGTFDGQGYEIRDLFINRPGEYYVGLFGAVGQEGVVKNIGLANVTVNGRDSVGGLVGFNDFSTVSNSHSSGNVIGDWDVGGLVGQNTGAVSNSYATGSVTANNRVGGLVGFNNYGTVNNSYSTSSVTGERQVGGLVGENRGTVSDSYSTSNVTGDVNVGGLVGANEEEGTVSDSFWDTETSGQVTSDGGTGKTTAEMQDIATFSGAGWNMIAVGGPSERNPTYIWNIVNGVTYPFLSWQS